MHTPRNIQSPYVASDFWAQWSSINPRMCTCLKVTPQSQWGATAIGFTSNTRDMTLPGHAGVTFLSTPGLSPSAIEQALDEPPNLEVMGIYQSGVITQSEVAAGKWNFADVELFSVCWDNVNLGELLHVKGNLGKFKDRQTYFSAEIRGLISRLSNDVHHETSRLCRAPEFQDPVYCKHSATTVVISGTTYNVSYTNIQADGAYNPIDTYLTFITPSATPTDYFANGKVTCTSGNNVGLSREIASSTYSAGFTVIQLKRPFPYATSGASGERFTLKAGCNRTIEACIQWGNILNRRAEDWIPGIEAVTRLPLA